MWQHCCSIDDMHILSILWNRKSNNMLLIQTEEGSLTQLSSLLQLSFHICWTLSLSVPPPVCLRLSDRVHVGWVCIEYTEHSNALFRWKVVKKTWCIISKNNKKMRISDTVFHHSPLICGSNFLFLYTYTVSAYETNFCISFSCPSP